MISVRRARPRDFAAMRDVFRAAGREAWSHIIPAEGLEQLEPPERWRWRGDRRHAVFVADRDGKVVGFVSARASGDDDAGEDRGEIDALYTAPAVWGEGAGRALLDEGLAFLAECGFRAATLWTAAENHRPRRFYEQYGFALDGTSRARTHLGGDFVEVRYRIGLER